MSNDLKNLKPVLAQLVLLAWHSGDEFQVAASVPTTPQWQGEEEAGSWKLLARKPPDDCLQLPCPWLMAWPWPETLGLTVPGLG